MLIFAPPGSSRKVRLRPFVFFSRKHRQITLSISFCKVGDLIATVCSSETKFSKEAHTSHPAVWPVPHACARPYHLGSAAKDSYFCCFYSCPSTWHTGHNAELVACTSLLNLVLLYVYSKTKIEPKPKTKQNATRLRPFWSLALVSRSFTRIFPFPLRSTFPTSNSIRNSMRRTIRGFSSSLRSPSSQNSNHWVVYSLMYVYIFCILYPHPD